MLQLMLEALLIRKRLLQVSSSAYACILLLAAADAGSLAHLQTPAAGGFMV
jgi:hypothetical protein